MIRLVDNFLNFLSTFYCQHEWIYRTEGTHVFLECLRCPKKTNGFV